VVNQATAEKNRLVLQRCLKDHRVCEGGYIKRVDWPIQRITSSCHHNCGHLEMSISSIKFLMAVEPPWLPKALEWVELPPRQGEDVTGWERAAVAYARQFTREDH
jgi:hypothetical protein